MPTTLPHRPDLTELMDDPRADRATLHKSLRDVRRINRGLGWTARVVRDLATVVESRKLHGFTLLDVATGSADIPLAIAARARRQGWGMTIIAGDLARDTLLAAHRQIQLRGDVSIRLVRFNAFHAPFADRSVDVVTLSLALHHFPPNDAAAILRELGRVARRALLVSDLERSWPGYLSARLLSLLLRNPITHHDAPVSVLRAYTADELRGLAARAGLRGAQVRHRFPFRLVLTWHPE